MKFRSMTIAAAAAALLATGVMAQDQSNTGATQPGTPPAATMNSPTAPKVTLDTQTTMDTNKTGPIEFSSSVNSGDILASDLIGMKVKNSAGDNLGDVNDLVIDPSGKPSVAVIGVGGFLGIGEKDVGVPFNRLQIAMDKNSKRVARLDTDKSTLKSAPNFVYQEKEASAQPVKTN